MIWGQAEMREEVISRQLRGMNELVEAVKARDDNIGSFELTWESRYGWVAGNLRKELLNASQTHSRITNDHIKSSSGHCVPSPLCHLILFHARRSRRSAPNNSETRNNCQGPLPRN